jgi:NTE family protein
MSKKPSEQSLYDQMENIVMQKTNYQVDSAQGVMMQFHLQDVSLMDFNKAQTLFDLGYNAALEMIDSIGGRIDRRVPLPVITDRRNAYKESLPPLIFENVYVSGTTEAQEIYIKNHIHRNIDNRFSIDDFKQTYFQLLLNPKIKEIMPQAEFNYETQLFDLYMDVKIENEMTVDFGGNISSTNANQIYLGVGYQSLTDISANFNLDTQLGNSYNGITLYGKLEMPSRIPVNVSAIFSSDIRKFYESGKLFIDTELSAFTKQLETYGRIGIELPFQINAKTELMIGYGKLEDQYYQSRSFIGAEYDRSLYNLLNVSLCFRKNTLDAKQYPIKGQMHKIYAQYISGKE